MTKRIRALIFVGVLAAGLALAMVALGPGVGIFVFIRSQMMESAESGSARSRPALAPKSRALVSTRSASAAASFTSCSARAAAVASCSALSDPLTILSIWSQAARQGGAGFELERVEVEVVEIAERGELGVGLPVAELRVPLGRANRGGAHGSRV